MTKHFTLGFIAGMLFILFILFCGKLLTKDYPKVANEKKEVDTISFISEHSEIGKGD